MERPGSISEQGQVPESLDGKRLDLVAARLFPDYSRARLQEWINDGRLRVNGEVCTRPRTGVACGDLLDLQAEAEPRLDEVSAQPIALQLRYEDAHLAVIDKPAGLTVHPGAGVADGTLQNALLHRYPDNVCLPRAGIVHRLDKLTSGLLVVARTLPAHTQLVRMLQERQIGREYDAVVWGRVVAGGTVDAPIGRDPRSRTKMAVVRGGRGALTHYRVHQRYGWHTHLRVQLETGRTHQIRVHMRHIRHPIVGDDTYGGRQGHGRGMPEALRDALRDFPRQALHARRLHLPHPVEGPDIDVEAPLPADMQALLALMQEQAPDTGD